jgi:outer membrane protein assembly factor BamB
MNRRLQWLASLALLSMLAACSKDKDVDPPAQLVELQPKIQIKELWSTGLSSDSQNLRLALRPAVDGKWLYAAAHRGEVVAFDAGNGRVRWRVHTKLRLSGGPGVGGGRVVVGSSGGDILALNAENGATQWQVRVNGEVLAPPAVTEKIVIIRTVDGRLRGLDSATGRELWITEQNVPRLSLRGTAAPVVVGDGSGANDMVICGFDNGKVVAVNLAGGDVLWETTVAPARGRTELERLVDIDSPVSVVDKDVYAVGFQGRAVMLALESGQTWWARDASSERGLVVDGDALYIAGENGDITALRRRDGAPLWVQKTLHRRGLSGLAIDGSTLVVADFQGYVHWLDAATGEELAREKTDGKRVTNAPLAADGKVFVLTDAGRLSAFRVQRSAG